MVPRCIAPSPALPLPNVHRAPRSAAWLLAGALLLPAPASAQELVTPAEDPWSGTYDVTGLTVDQATSS